jgi:flagellar basal-body rod protein FlgF
VHRGTAGIADPARTDMNNTSYIALSNQMALQLQMDVLANNVANASTPSYKAQSLLFSEYLSPQPGQPVSFVVTPGTVRDTRQGPLTQTGNPLDIALEGNGYFAVQTPAGVQYTRNGHLQLDAQGELVTSQGYQVLTAAGQPITLPANSGAPTIGADGSVSTRQGSVGQIGIVTFDQPQALAAAEGGLYVTDQAPQPATNTKMSQGMIEESNVQPIIAMTRLMSASRAFGAAQDLVNMQSNLELNAINQLGKVV